MYVHAAESPRTNPTHGGTGVHPTVMRHAWGLCELQTDCKKRTEIFAHEKAENRKSKHNK